MRLNDSNKTIKFNTLEECIELKNYLVVFIKDIKREIKDHGNDPEIIINLKNFNTYVIGMLNYKFVQRLIKKEVKIKKTICWYENHELKGWNMGFRKFFPKTKTLGYQGFSPLLPLMNSFPTKNEEKFKVIPEKIIVTSNKYKPIVNEFNKDIRITVDLH